ncbi:MAG: class II aldolase/adducin family protein [Desulfobacterales bacterium]|jgi:L-fuculose-phosphate aldolase
MGTEQALRKEIIAICCKMNQSGLNQGTSGNVSVRWREGMMITPSGVPYEETEPDDICYFDFSSHQSQGPHNPSSEWRVHRDILSQRDDIHAVVHTHSTYATAMAIQRLDIPAHHYMVAAAGGSKILCADYATFGTAELSQQALRALGDQRACLLANHGVIALGATLAKALGLAQEVETLARQYYVASHFGQPVILPEEEMKKILCAFESYGLKNSK